MNGAVSHDQRLLADDFGCSTMRCVACMCCAGPYRVYGSCTISDAQRRVACWLAKLIGLPVAADAAELIFQLRGSGHAEAGTRRFSIETIA